jgi:exo-beta-1,3-glucanase (GH17 family)
VLKAFYILLIIFCCTNYNIAQNKNKIITAANILGNPTYKAICYGGYRNCNRTDEPTVEQIKDDLKILAALKIKVLRTYNVHHTEIKNLLIAIAELKKERKRFEMYVMLGVWIDCKNAWTKNTPIHNEESERNTIEIDEAVRLANKYSSIIKIIAVGNEAMVNWATNYYVTPNIILKWVTYLQNLKLNNKLPKNIWITSSDNFASWGGGDSSYHTNDLKKLIAAVDYVSIHTYPMHDTHYNPIFWGLKSDEKQLSDKEKISAVMLRARNYATEQYNNVVAFIKACGLKKQVHLGETGWASQCNELYGNKGSKAVDEYKAAVYYQLISEWVKKQKITCFYFEAFDECWKNANNPMHSENHFGFINLQGQAKYGLWKWVDDNTFKNLKRNGKYITKTFNGDIVQLMKTVQIPNIILKD